MSSSNGLPPNEIPLEVVRLRTAAEACVNRAIAAVEAGDDPLPHVREAREKIRAMSFELAKHGEIPF